MESCRVLSDQQELQLMNYIERDRELFVPPSRSVVARVASRMARRKVSDAWISRFMAKCNEIPDDRHSNTAKLVPDRQTRELIRSLYHQLAEVSAELAIQKLEIEYLKESLARVRRENTRKNKAAEQLRFEDMIDTLFVGPTEVQKAKDILAAREQEKKQAQQDTVAREETMAQEELEIAAKVAIKNSRANSKSKTFAPKPKSKRAGSVTLGPDVQTRSRIGRAVQKPARLRR